MKKLLLTIIILGACLIGSSQNWDSVRVGNIDVDSIMLGGAKIWEKQNVDTTSWTYEGVMTVGSYNDTFFGYAYTEGGFSLGQLNPKLYPQSFSEQILFQTNTPGYYVLSVDFTDENQNQLSALDTCLLNINEVDYMLSSGGNNQSSWSIIIESNPFPPVGETCEIKLRYTLAP